jgi:hypothetical protein
MPNSDHRNDANDAAINAWEADQFAQFEEDVQTDQPDADTSDLPPWSQVSRPANDIDRLQQELDRDL